MKSQEDLQFAKGGIVQVQRIKEAMLWRTMNGEILNIREMKTGHLFNSVKMIYNHMAELIGFPTFWFSNKYESHTKRWIEDPEAQLNTLKEMVEELDAFFTEKYNYCR